MSEISGNKKATIHADGACDGNPGRGGWAGFVPPAPFIPNSIGHHKEWAQACKTRATTTCREME
jgi:ribonuclease HI